MIHPDDEQLISGYLDGELTAHEQARAESLLATNPRFRQLYDDLRALHAGFEALPRYAVGENLAERVLRRAELEVLAGKGGEVSVVSVPSTAADEPAPRLLRWPRGERPWIYAALALAAALVISLTSNWNQGDRGRLAQAPPSKTDYSREGKASKADAKPRDALAKAPGADTGDEIAAGSRFSQSSAEQSPANGTIGRPNAPAGPAVDAESKSVDNGGGLAGHSDSGSAASGAERIEFKRETSGGFAGKRAREKGVEKLADKAPMDRQGRASRSGAGAMAGKLAENLGAPSELQPVLVVYCDVTSDALRRDAFGKLLARNAIAWREADAKGPATGQALRTEADALHEEPVAQRGSGRSAEPLDGIVVDASPAAIEATLAELHKSTAEFPTIQMASATPAARAAFGNYERAREPSIDRPVEAALKGAAPTESAPKEAVSDETRRPKSAPRPTAGDNSGLELLRPAAASAKAEPAPAAAQPAPRRGQTPVTRNSVSPKSVPPNPAPPKSAPGVDDSAKPAARGPLPAAGKPAAAPGPLGETRKLNKDFAALRDGGAGEGVAPGAPPKNMAHRVQVPAEWSLRSRSEKAKDSARAAGVSAAAAPRQRFKQEAEPANAPTPAPTTREAAGAGSLRQQSSNDSLRVLFVLRVVDSPAQPAAPQK